MQATQIKVGQWYAVSTSPRKGITDLYGIPAQKRRVTQMGVQRFNPTGGEGMGTWKNDGIKCEYIDSQNNLVQVSEVYKARDFLMPWADYDVEIQRRKADADQKAKERAEKRAVHNDRLDMLRAEMAGYDLRHTPENAYLGIADTDGHTRDFCIPENGRKVIMTIEAAERLMAGVAQRIYEGIRDGS